jgi:hypothetical protein
MICTKICEKKVIKRSVKTGEGAPGSGASFVNSERVNSEVSSVSSKRLLSILTIHPSPFTIHPFTIGVPASPGTPQSPVEKIA